ncbi:hypothetical protein O6H91_02G082000 [Diphasiastrum complanatum]|nr:hypothetical protein O6H91_02G082000 [Diphasiastrum complanatum]
MRKDYLDLVSHSKVHLHSNHISRLLSIDDENPVSFATFQDIFLRSSSSYKRQSATSSILLEGDSTRLSFHIKQHDREASDQNLFHPVWIDPTKARCRECEEALHFLDSIDASWRSAGVTNVMLGSCDKCQWDELHDRESMLDSHTNQPKRNSIDYVRRTDPTKRAGARKGIEEPLLKRIDDHITDSAKSAKDKSRWYASYKESPKMVERVREGPTRNNNSPIKVAKTSSLEPRNVSIHPPRFSYDGEESFRSSSDPQSMLYKSKEAPRYSLDGRESPRSFTDSLRSNYPGKPLERQSTRLLLDTARQLPLQIDSFESAKNESVECKRRSPNVVARLMGLEEMPERILPHQSNSFQTKLSTEAELLQELLDHSPLRHSAQARHTAIERSGSSFLHRTSEESLQKKPVSAGALSFLPSEQSKDTVEFQGKVALRPLLAPRHLMEIMPPPLKQKSLKLSSKSKSNENALTKEDKQSKQKPEFQDSRVFLAELEKQRRKFYTKESLKGYNNRSEEVFEGVLLKRFFHSVPTKKHEGSRECDKLRMESVSRQGQLLRSFSLQKQVHESGEASETSYQSGPKLDKIAQAHVDVASNMPTHSPRRKTKMNSKLEDHVTGTKSVRGVEKNMVPSASSPAKILVASPTIHCSKTSAKIASRAESLRDNDVSVSSKSSTRRASKSQKVIQSYLKSSDSKKVAQSLATHDRTDEAVTLRSQHIQKVHIEKQLTTTSVMECSKVPPLKSLGHKQKPTKSASNHDSQFHSKNRSAENGPFRSRIGHLKQSSKEKKGKKSFWSKPLQENALEMVMNFSDGQSAQSTGNAGLHSGISDVEMPSLKSYELEDVEIAEERELDTLHQQTRNTLADEISDSAVRDIMNESSRTRKEQSCTQIEMMIDTIQNSTTSTGQDPVNNLQEAENSSLETNPYASPADQEEVDHGCALHKCKNEPVTTKARAFQYDAFLELEMATPPESPSSIKYQPDKQIFMEDYFEEPPEQPSPLSVLDASLLLDACSPKVVHNSQNVNLEEFQAGSTGLKATQLSQAQDGHLKCRELDKMFEMGQSFGRESTSCAVNSTKDTTEYAKLDTPILAAGAVLGYKVQGKQVMLSEDEQFQYVQDILMAAQYADEVEVFGAKFDLNDLPISKDMFSLVENIRTNFSTSINIRDAEHSNEQPEKPNLDAIQRKLLVDCVNDILENKLWPESHTINLNKEHRAQVLLRLVTQEMQELFSQPSQSATGMLHAMLEGSLSKEKHWCIFESEILDVVNDIERLIFKQLLDESLLDLIALSRRMSNIHYKSRSILFSR